VEEGKQEMSGIQQKAKTTGEIIDEVRDEIEYALHNFPRERLDQRLLDIRRNTLWVSLSVAEADKRDALEKVVGTNEDFLIRMLMDECKARETMERERGLLKQKLRQFDIYLAEAYGKNGSALPIVLKFQELLRE
jgi:hypothetical protein